MSGRMGTLNRERIIQSFRQTLDQGGTEALILGASMVVGALFDAWEREGEECDRMAEALITYSAKAPDALAAEMLATAISHGAFLRAPTPFDDLMAGQP